MVVMVVHLLMIILLLVPQVVVGVLLDMERV
jgi:uncharacterized SAM-binding protein YcdF (DUF218 family)